MAISGPHIRSEHWRSFDYTVPSGGVTAGAMDKIQDTVVVFAETKTVGEIVAAIYQADKILVPKYAATGYAIVQGEKVYYNDYLNKVVADTTSGNTLCGRCMEAADADDTEVLIDLSGNIAA
jgi:predicted RecA/RadA family phage recombinase